MKKKAHCKADLIADVDAGAVVEEHAHDGRVAAAGRQHQRRDVVLSVDVDVGLLLQQRGHRIGEALVAGPHQRRPSSLRRFATAPAFI